MSSSRQRDRQQGMGVPVAMTPLPGMGANTATHLSNRLTMLSDLVSYYPFIYI